MIHSLAMTRALGFIFYCRAELLVLEKPSLFIAAQTFSLNSVGNCYYINPPRVGWW